MSKFHVNPETGNAGACRAEGGGCPFGGADQHYGTQQEAQGAYEAKMETEHGTVSSQKKEVDLSSMDSDEKIDLAEDTRDSALLTRLADEDNYQVREAVAKNSSTYPETLAELAANTDEDIVTKNPNTPAETLTLIAERHVSGEGSQAEYNILDHPNVSAGALAWMADSNDEQLVRLVEGHPLTDTQTLEHIADQRYAMDNDEG